jgi:hypothetical protein
MSKNGPTILSHLFNGISATVGFESDAEETSGKLEENAETLQ